MLRLEIRYHKERNGIILKEKQRSFFSNRLFKALFLSLFLHLSSLILFKVHMLQFEGDRITPFISDVSLDVFPSTEKNACVKAEYPTQCLDPFEALLIDSCYGKRSTSCKKQQKIPAFKTDEKLPETLSQFHKTLPQWISSTLPKKWEIQSLELFQHYYPIRLELQGKLSKGQLVADGSILFKKRRKNYFHSVIGYTDSSTYRVTINPYTGKVSEFRHKKRADDLKLQKISDQILGEIVFDIASLPTTPTGEVTIFFKESYQEIRSQMSKRKKR